MDDAREEMRKIIDVIEKGAKSTSVEQAVDDIKLFANTASFLANALDTRLKTKDAKPKSCLLYTSPSPRDLSTSRMPSSA